MGKARRDHPATHKLNNRIDLFWEFGWVKNGWIELIIFGIIRPKADLAMDKSNITFLVYFWVHLLQHMTSNLAIDSFLFPECECG